jgi:hypothetical protein
VRWNLRIEILGGSKAEKWLKTYRKGFPHPYLDADGMEAVWIIYSLRLDIIAGRIRESGKRIYRKAYRLRSGKFVHLAISEARPDLLLVEEIDIRATA